MAAKTTVNHKPKGPLNWSGPRDKDGLTRKEHVKLHGIDNSSRNVAHGVFNQNPIHTTQQAWNKAIKDGISPQQNTPNGNWIYDIPMSNAGRQMGNPNLPGYGSATSHVRIVVKPNTNTIITAFPLNP